MDIESKIYNISGTTDLTVAILSDLANQMEDPTIEDKWSLIRKVRNALILETDWIVAAIVEKSKQIPQTWIDYRQALRDTPETYLTPEEAVFPTKPLEVPVDSLQPGVSGGAAAWGTISGTLSSQTDLISALGSKSETSHGHNLADLAEKSYSSLTDKPIIPSAMGYTINLMALNQATTTDGQTLYWGGVSAAPSTTAAIARVYIPKSGTIKSAYVYTRAATAGTAESWSVSIRLNNTTDTLIQAQGVSASVRLFSNTSLNIPVVAGNFLEIKEVFPTWATNPANVTRGGAIYIE